MNNSRDPGILGCFFGGAMLLTVAFIVVVVVLDWIL